MKKSILYTFSFMQKWSGAINKMLFDRSIFWRLFYTLQFAAHYEQMNKSWMDIYIIIISFIQISIICILDIYTNTNWFYISPFRTRGPPRPLNLQSFHNLCICLRFYIFHYISFQFLLFSYRHNVDSHAFFYKIYRLTVTFLTLLPQYTH